MGHIKVDTEAIVGSAVGLGRVSAGVSSGAGRVLGSGAAAAGTGAAGAYGTLVARCARAVSQLGHAGDEMAVAAQRAAECYVAADRLTG